MTLIIFKGGSPEYGHLIEVNLNTASVNEDLVASNDMIVYPNPSTGEFTLDLGSVEPTSITIFDMTAKQVLKLPNQTKQEVVLDVENGIYILKIETAEASKEVKLLINK